MEASDPLEPLRRALELDPENDRLRLILAESLAKEGRAKEALSEYGRLWHTDKIPTDALLAAAWTAFRAGNYSLAALFSARARELGVVEGVADLQHEIDDALGLAGQIKVVNQGGDDDSLSLVFDSGVEATTFADVGGLADVKKAINRIIILPLQQAELYERFGRRAGGGVLLYGPPGCGKTLLARATAGECQLPFLNLRIEEIVDPFFGVSEQKLHAAFERARAAAPCVLFIDELDAIGFARRKFVGNAGRPLVDQLLQEMDAIGSDNEGILILAATNAPWDVDEALKRPGRFDRSVFVSPPDQPAREAILEIMLRGRPTASIEVAPLAKKTSLFSGADLKAVVERATDAAIDETLATGTEQPISMVHLAAAVDAVLPSTAEWIATARRYVEFANDAGRYDDVSAYLRTKEARGSKSR